jgi:hypothetical protein
MITVNGEMLDTPRHHTSSHNLCVENISLHSVYGPLGGRELKKTTFEISCNRFRFWLKNANAGGEKKVWRYQHFDSYATYEQKRATLTACLRKVQRMASDRDALESSGRHGIPATNAEGDLQLPEVRDGI